MKTKNCNVCILGDSYSTFLGCIPEGQAVYYPRIEKVADVTEVTHTWWQPLFERRNMKLLINDSYSGSTVCKDTRPGQGSESAFVYRMHNTLSEKGIGGEMPDVIFLFGTTNDSWLDRNVGENMYENRTEQDLFSVLPAACEMIEYVTAHNPQAKVFVLINCGIKDEIRMGLKEAAEHYGAVPVVLHDIDKSNGHPTRLGMAQISAQVEEALNQEEKA